MTALILAAVLAVSDPPDAVGNGTLSLPTALVFQTPGVYDVERVEIPNTETLTLELSLAHLNNPWNLPLGFSLPLIELYLATESPGQTELLPGSGMQLPKGASWSYAFKVTGDGFTVFQAQEGRAPRDVTTELQAELFVQNNSLRIKTSLPRPKQFSLYGMVGSYDPWSEDGSGWRTVEQVAGPFVFSSTGQQRPVADVIADSYEAQVEAINSGILPEIRAPVRRNGWVALMMLGSLLMLAGLVLRLRLTRVKAVPVTPSSYALPEPADDKAKRNAHKALTPVWFALDETANAEWLDTSAEASSEQESQESLKLDNQNPLQTD